MNSPATIRDVARKAKVETVFSSRFFLQLIKGVIENITGKNSKKSKILVPADLIMRESS